MAVTGFMQTLNILGVYNTHLQHRLSKNKNVYRISIGPTSLYKMVGPDGLEPSTPRLSSACSNQLSYEPTIGK